MINTMLNDILQCLKKAVTFSGRATRREYWTFFCFTLVVLVILGILCGLAEGSTLGDILLGITGLIGLALLVPNISVSVRRLHDVNLSGFWMWYLMPLGLPVVYMAYLLDLDPACNAIINKIQNIGSCWLGWILTILFWGAGAPITLFLIYLYAGKKEDNFFGPNPYEEKKPETTTL